LAVTDEIVEAMQRLLPQIDSGHHPPSKSDLAAVVSCPCTCWLVARDAEGRLVGTLTLIVFRVPSQVRAWFENVVVDAAARGQGIGQALCRDGLRRAAARGAPAVELTSRSARQAATRLYTQLGFVQRDTNAYRYRLGAGLPGPGARALDSEV
jgi:ribosomal protein S18 acetylase RimI-like enzyme